MTFYRFILRSLWYFRKQGLALFAGTLISTTVLTGALIIGDSVKYSLIKLVDMRLGKTDYVLVAGNRFVRADLAGDIAKRYQVSSIKNQVIAAPVLMLQGIAVNTETKVRINRVQVLGIDSSFGYIANKFQVSSFKFQVNDDEAIISGNIAGKLNLKVGDEFLLRVQKADLVPINILFTTEDAPNVAFRLTVKAIAGDDNMGRFSLKSNQVAPYNVFISRNYLSKKLKLEGLANVILISEKQSTVHSPQSTVNNNQLSNLNSQLNKVWEPEDAGLKIRDLPESGKYEITSDRVFIDEPVARAIQSINIPHENILTYLVNTIHHKDKETPYSFVTAASPPLLPANLNNDDIIVNGWLVRDLNLSTGDTVSLDYYVIGPLRTLKEQSKSFIVKDIIGMTSLEGMSSLTNFPGLSDAVSCRNWNTSIPVNLKRIRDKDEQYWKDFKGTPKAFIPLQTGIILWRNQIGSLTAIRFDKKNITLNELRKQIINKIRPEDVGIRFIPVRKEGLEAAGSSVDFGELFLSLSFFIIAAGVLLTILIYVLNTESRSKETAILSGLGFSRKLIIKIRFAEFAVIILFGGIAGALTGILYNYGLIAGLNSVWQDVIRTKMLGVFIKPETLLLGAISGIVISCLSVFIVTYKKLKQPVAELLKVHNSKYKIFQILKIWKITSFVCIIGAICIVSYSIITSAYENEILFLTAGGLLLISSVALILHYLAVNNQQSAVSNQQSAVRRFGLMHLSLKNAGTNKGRSISIIVLLAIGIFSIVVVGSREKGVGSREKREVKNYQSGTGGYHYWVETAIPVPYNLNIKSTVNSPQSTVNSQQSTEGIHFVQMHGFEGDDASCLNLNLVAHPRILGINPEEFDKRKAFSFVKLLKDVNKEHPWLALNRELGVGSRENGVRSKELQKIYPAYADQTVIKYNLKKSVGDTLTYINEYGNEIGFRLIGGLDNSIFQGNILISDSIFMLNFPTAAGSKIILADAPNSIKYQVSSIKTKVSNSQIQNLKSYIQNDLLDYGAEITPASERLDEFNSVENAYLSVFMVLGGLGIIISTLGLGIVILRNMLERRQELALLLAVGYTKHDVFKLVLIENLFLLLSGLACGIGAAIITTLPSLVSHQLSVISHQSVFLLLLIAIILISGIIWIYFPAKNAMKGNLIKALRND